MRADDKVGKIRSVANL